MIAKTQLLNLKLNQNALRSIVKNEFPENIKVYENHLITLSFNNNTSILNIFFKTKTNNKTSFQTQGKDPEDALQCALYLIDKTIITDMFEEV